VLRGRRKIFFRGEKGKTTETASPVEFGEKTAKLKSTTITTIKGGGKKKRKKTKRTYPLVGGRQG